MSPKIKVVKEEALVKLGLVTNTTPETNLLKKELVAKLSNESYQVLKIILTSPSEIFGCDDFKPVKRPIKEYIRNRMHLRKKFIPIIIKELESLTRQLFLSE